MAKIMLVEDDNNLREIYEARLLAEGYEIVSAKDGEEALALAVKEKPDLIISDVMMPKISGFDMLDILRSTPETKNTKVIMMTALSQAEDKARADKLGADRYLVKSQVTLEDVAKVAREVLSGESGPSEAAATPEPTPVAEPAAVSEAPLETSTTESAEPAATEETAELPVATESTMPLADAASAAQSAEDEKASVDEQINAFASQPATDSTAETPAGTSLAEAVSTALEASSKSTPTENGNLPTEAPIEQISVATPPPANDEEGKNDSPPAMPSPDPLPEPEPLSSVEAATGVDGVSKRKTLQPLGDVSNAGPDLNDLLAKEEAKEAGSATPGTDASSEDEENPAEPPKPTDGPDPNSIAL